MVAAWQWRRWQRGVGGGSSKATVAARRQCGGGGGGSLAVAAVAWLRRQCSCRDGSSAATVRRWQRVSGGSGGSGSSLAAAQHQRWQQHGGQSGGRWRQQLGSGSAASAVLVIINGEGQRQLSGCLHCHCPWNSGLLLRILVSLISSMVDGWKSCDVELLCVCNLFTLICESRSTVPRGPPRLTYL